MTLVDSHCHLNLPEFDLDLGECLARARSAEVARFVVPGIDVPTSRKAVEMARDHSGLYAAVGVHPHEAGGWGPAALAELRALAADPTVVAIGEIGLDYFRLHSPQDQQMRAFEEQLQLAGELGLPVIVHQRQSADDILKTLEAWAGPASGSSRPRGVLHAFSADAEAARRGVAAGFLLGVAGPVTYASAGDLRSSLRQVAIDQLLVETDSPHLPPHPHRGQRNEPARLPLIAGALAAALDLPIATVAGQTTSNAQSLFGWDHGTGDRDLS